MFDGQTWKMRKEMHVAEAIKFSKIPPDFNKKLNILHHVDRPLAKLNVGQLCKKASISRGTFYHYFESKYEIGHWYVSVCNDVSVCEIGRTLSWKEAFLRQFILVKQEEAFFHIIHDDFKGQGFLSGPFALREANIREALRLHGVEMTEKLRCELDIYSKTEVNATWKWACGTTTLSAEEYADMLVECVPRTLYDSLKRPLIVLEGART